jgi:hypothetical protein
MNSSIDKKFIQSFTKEESPYHFFVKGGHTNYLGDLYFMSPQKESSNWFSPDLFSLSIRQYNFSEHAKTFMKKFHPEIQLPFVESLLKRTAPKEPTK